MLLYAPPAHVISWPCLFREVLVWISTINKTVAITVFHRCYVYYVRYLTLRLMNMLI
jgi:hypothetical protein